MCLTTYRIAGGVIAAATGIVEHHNPAMLREHGGTVELGKKWADSILSRIKRKATKAARKLCVFLMRIL